MIYTDGVHLIGDSLQELHKFAYSVGLKREWFQEHYRHPHYDITTPRKLRKILATGKAEMIKTRQLLKGKENKMKKPTYTGQLVNISGDKSKLKIMQGKVYLLTFDWFGKRVGSIEMKGKKLHFEGNADKSAKLLFDKLIGFVEQYIEERLKAGIV